MATIKFDKPTYYASKGRNGYLLTHGVAVYDIGTGDFDEVHLQPLTSRGDVSDACRLVIRKSAIPELIKALTEVAGPRYKTFTRWRRGYM
jgi:hypothetical protein